VRRRHQLLRGLLCIVAAVVAGACGVLSPEEQLLGDFFEASRLHDTTMVAKIATVTFNPRTDGIVQEFAVRDVAEEAGDQVRNVTVVADVRMPDGRMARRTLRVTMARRQGRLFITGLSGAGGP
jgi:hypothetical protein